ncbi:retrovirus-related pol polyprotein from transposon TNT 1-94 [Tanacetum coccineum]
MKNKEVYIEEHHRNLLLSKNKRHVSSKCKNIKLAIRNDKSEVVCAMCKECLITANHDVCVLNYVNDMNSRDNKQSVNVSNIENQKKHKPKVKKPKKVGSKERLASPTPSEPSICRRNLLANGFQILPLFLAGCPNLFMFLGTVRFGNDHIAAILGYGDLKWGNILITRVYFVEGFRHNLFSVGQFCDSNLEVTFRRNTCYVTFRRNTCYVRNLRGVDLLKGNRTTNLYTINLHEITSASPICLIARATSTKSWLWHQRLSYLNFNTINDFARNDLVTGLPKFKYHKEDHGDDERLDLTYAPSTITSQKPTERDLDLLFEAMYDDYIGGQPSAATRTSPAAQAHHVLQTPTQQDDQALLQPENVADNVSNAMLDENTFVNPFATPSTDSAESTSHYVDPSNMHTFYQSYPHEYQWTKDHPLE